MIKDHSYRICNIAEPARIECGAGAVAVFMDREEGGRQAPLRALELARRCDAVKSRHGNVEHDDIRMKPVRLSQELASIARSTDH